MLPHWQQVSFQVNAQNMSYTFITGDPNNSNPWYNNYTASNRNDYAISKTMTDYMEPKNDPRLRVYGEVLAGNVVTGLTYGKCSRKYSSSV